MAPVSSRDVNGSLIGMEGFATSRSVEASYLTASGAQETVTDLCFVEIHSRNIPCGVDSYSSGSLKLSFNAARRSNRRNRYRAWPTQRNNRRSASAAFVKHDTDWVRGGSDLRQAPRCDVSSPIDQRADGMVSDWSASLTLPDYGRVARDSGVIP
jgi:hypothetical protein